MKALRIAIVGGGWAGLAAAVKLAEAGAHITLFEAARQLGGRARRVDSPGPSLDNGQHILSGAYHATLELMRQVGVNLDQTLLRQALDLNYPGADFRIKLPRLVAPLHLACGLLRARGSRLTEKWAAARFIQALQACAYQLNADESVAALLDRHQQHGALRRLMWEPLCLAALNTAPENASAQIFAYVLRDSLGGPASATDLLLPTVDLSALLPKPAAHFIKAHGGKIELSTRIDSLASFFATRSLRGEKFDHLILALAPQHAARLLAKTPETHALAQTLASYTYEPIATLYLAYPPSVKLPCPMLGLGDGKTPALGQWVFDRGALLGTPGILSFVLSAHGAWESLDKAALARALHGELQTALGQKLPSPLKHQLICERRATFSCRPNLPRLSTQTSLNGFWLAGDYLCSTYPATLESAVRSGIAAAQQIIQ